MRASTRLRPRPCTHTHRKAHTHAQARTHTRAGTHTQKYEILIAFPQQQWYRERHSMLCHTYIACLFLFAFVIRVRSKIPVTLLLYVILYPVTNMRKRTSVPSSTLSKHLGLHIWTRPFYFS